MAKFDARGVAEWQYPLHYPVCPTAQEYHLKRNPASLGGQEFDLLIVGGGAFGACAAWEAVLRNYSVALIEANDFGSGASANSLKFVHGGIRYLQHLDLSRLRESCRERSALLRIAPHLVRPRAVAMPTYGHGRSGKELLSAAFKTYDALTIGRNRGIRDVTRHIPKTAFMSREEVMRRFDGIELNGLTGAAVFNDAQMYHPPRLVLSFLLSAVGRGAVALNYVEAASLIRTGDRICGVIARDRLTGEEFTIRSRVVLNAAGPWSEDLLQRSEGLEVPGAGVYSRDTCFIVDGAPEPDYALAVQGKSVDKGAVIGRGARHLFVVPWRGRRLIGVWHIVYKKGPDAIDVSEQELERFLSEFNSSIDSMAIERKDIRLVNAGLVPFGESDDTGVQLNFGKKSHLVDSESAHGLQGLVTLIGVRHTMARGDAAKAMDIVDRKLRRSGNVPDSAEEPVLGGDLHNFDGLADSVRDRLRDHDSHGLSGELTALYGTGVVELLEAGRASGTLGRVQGSDILGAQIDAGVKHEMAVTLGDLVFRRTPLAAAGNPGEAVLRACAEAMGKCLGWSAARRRQEVEAVMTRFPTPSHAGRISERPVPLAAGQESGEMDVACPGR